MAMERHLRSHDRAFAKHPQVSHWESACVQDIASLCDPSVDWMSVQHCLSRNIELLSPSCVEAVVAEISKDSWAKPRIPDHKAPDLPVPREIARWEPNDGPLRGRDDDPDDSNERPVAVYNEHHGGVWDHRHHEKTTINHEANHHHEHYNGVHPLVLIIVFPFFCVGIYESAKRAMAYYKAHRRGAGYVSNLDDDYEPVKTHEIP